MDVNVSEDGPSGRFWLVVGRSFGFLGAAFLRGKAPFAGIVNSGVGVAVDSLGNAFVLAATFRGVALGDFLATVLGSALLDSVLEANARFVDVFWAEGIVSAKGAAGTVLAFVATFFDLGGLALETLASLVAGSFLEEATFLRGAFGSAKTASVFAIEAFDVRLGFGEEEGAVGTQRGIHISTKKKQVCQGIIALETRVFFTIKTMKALCTIRLQ